MLPTVAIMEVMIKHLLSNLYSRPPVGISKAPAAMPNDGQVDADKVVFGGNSNAEAAKRPDFRQVQNSDDATKVKPGPPETLLLNIVKISEAKKLTKVPTEVLEKAQELLDRGDRGGSYLTLYKELGNDQLLIQAQITTYTGIWGSGALTGNYMAQRDGGDKYTTKLDDFSTEIAQATINAVRKDLDAGERDDYRTTNFSARTEPSGLVREWRIFSLAMCSSLIFGITTMKTEPLFCRKEPGT